MLAALLLNLGVQPPQPPAQQNFGGGPFWSRYGYDKSYDAIRTQTSSAIAPIEPVVVQPIQSYQRPLLNYRVINARVAETVAKEMREFSRKELQRRQQEAEDEEIETLLLMFGD